MVFGRSSKSNNSKNNDNDALSTSSNNNTNNNEAPLETAYQTFADATHSVIGTLMNVGSGGDGNVDVDDPLATTPTNNTTNNNTILYRGFGSSISDAFADPNFEHVDCCSLFVCGGILQTDLTRYLLTGVRPPTICKRFLMHVLVPLCLFLTAGMAAMRIQDVLVNQLVCTSLILLLVFYLILQCQKGRNKRLAVRKDVLFHKYQLLQHQQRRSSSLLFGNSNSTIPNNHQLLLLLDQERPNDTNTSTNASTTPDYYLGQTQTDVRHAHPCCLACYSEDRPKGVSQRDNNLCSNLYETCCPDYCGHHLQVCGVCAVAQEARDVQLYILPKPYRNVDYLTMQNYLDYYVTIYKQRHQLAVVHNNTNNSNNQKAILGHALSRLSYRLLQILLLFVGLMLLWSLLGRYYWYFLGRRYGRVFSIIEFGILLLVFAYGILVVWIARYIIHQYNNRDSELSLDALIKYFASGFFLSASLAIFWECVVIYVFDTFVSLVLAAAGVVSMDDPEKDWTSFQDIFWPGDTFSITSTSSSTTLYHYSHAGIGKPAYAEVFGMDHPILYTLYLLFATFVATAFIEELCKYFGYRMVEHPDFLSAGELEESMSTVGRRDDHDDDEESGDHRDDDDEESRRHQHLDFSLQGTSLQAQGAAVTLAMVTTAVGFAVAENLMYVFFYGGRSVHLELSVLVERMLFPVHPILAAIQSVSVVQRRIEQETLKIGRIIKMSVLFHGAFDFSIVLLGFLGKLLGKDTQYISLIVCVSIMGASILYLHQACAKQRQRLAAKDIQGSASSRLL